MNLYQWVFGYQPKYVVALSFGDAETTIKARYGVNAEIERIECLGPYVLLSLDTILEAAAVHLQDDEED